MLKVLLNIAILAVVAYVVYVKFFKKPTQKTENKSGFKQVDDTIMIACDKCGTFIGSEESIAKDGKFYCCKECAGVKA